MLTLPKDILFNYNVQHDCNLGACAASGSRKITQERNETDKVEEYVEHSPVDQYVINMHAFHNANFVRGALPRSLTEPLPYSRNREAYHHEIASEFRNIQDGKREALARKAEDKKLNIVNDNEGPPSTVESQKKRKRPNPSTTTDSQAVEPSVTSGRSTEDRISMIVD